MTKVSIETEKQIVSMRKEGTGFKKIGRILKVPEDTVSAILIRNGMTDHFTMPSTDLVEQIISEYAKGKGMKTIAKELNIPQRKVAKVLLIKGTEITPSGYHRGYEKKVNHSYFEKIDDEHKAYWLGFLYADGYNNEHSYQIELSLKAEDKYVLEELKKDTQAVYKIRDRQVSLNGKFFPQSRFTIYSKKMSQDLACAGCHQRKSLSITFPDESIVPQQFVHHFMRGYFDGDGCISGNKFMVNGTKEFLDKYIAILRANTEISPAGIWSMDGQAYRWQHAAYRDLVRIYDFLYEGSTICLERKKNRFLNFK